MAWEASDPGPASRDPLLRVLEIGLLATLVLAPLPFGAVAARGRLALEIAALGLLAIWALRAARRPPVTLPPRSCLIGICGLLALGLVQAAPLGAGAVGRLSPRALEVREQSRTSGEALEAERGLLGEDPGRLDPPAALSLDPPRTASAVRTGAALAALFLVATTVAAARGLRGIAIALLVAAALQGLYGTLVLASGHPMIWTVPKKHYLDSATGTFVNRNHFAGFLAACLPCGLALVLADARRHLARADGGGVRQGVLRALRSEGARTLFAGLLLALGISGLLLSFSRAGIALGLSALLLVAVASGRRGVEKRLLGVLLVLAVATVPLAHLGAERLLHRYRHTARDLAAPGGRSVVWADTLSMTARFPTLGVGFGAFDSAYPLFRSPPVRRHYDHAHNDALQALAEGGAVGALFLALLLGPVLAGVVAALGKARGDLAIGLAAGLTAALLHALVDFNFHIPANAAVASALAGGLVGTSCARGD